MKYPNGVTVDLGEGIEFSEELTISLPFKTAFVPGKNYRYRLPYTGKLKMGGYTWYGLNIGLECGSIGTTIIGEHCWIDHNAVIGHDAKIGDRTIIGPNANILGEVEIGEDCHIAAGAVIQPKVKVGNRCFIGNNTVITKDVPDGWIVFQHPKRVMKPNKWYPPNSDYDTTAHHRCF